MTGKIYFKNLNGFRFIAAMMVIICHLELFKEKIGQPNAWKFPLIFESGSAGVDFFFVLSGFLITTLLLSEKFRYGQIDLKKFYIRRILRIWPLYYLVLLICFLVIPRLSGFYIEEYSEFLQISFWRKFIFSILLMPNAALFFFGEIPYTAPLWSIGAEEQFYLFWPLLISIFSKQLRAILIFIIFFIGLKFLLFLIGMSDSFNPEQFEKIKNFIVGTRLECMGIGGLGAYFHYNKMKPAAWLSSNRVSVASVILLMFVLFFSKYLFELHHIILSCLFLTIIINGATNKHTFIRLENKLMYYLGTISYGLYVWHPLCIGATIWIFRKAGIWNESFAAANFIYYLMSIGLTILVSSISYNYFERNFLRYKTQFTVIVSGNEAKEAGELTT